MYQDSKGHRWYECGRPGYVGKAQVMTRRYGHEVLGPYFNGKLDERNPEEAAKIACGERQKMKQEKD